MNWQPIDSAPKDGSRILLYRADWQECFAVGWWSWDHMEWIPVCGTCFPGPTHWAPLQAP
jgi:hypothetical protein